MADEAKAREIFNHFDRNHNGTIEAVELKTVLAELGRPLSDEEVAGLIANADLNSDGVVSFPEFFKMIQNLH